ncbi:hypothetical protein ALC62_14979 [Cyphomyrmex costatus]|uniref:Gustatory receptor n=1 Tax=Cyphomyrmex costatus TaxID=456900 RepID=A0A195C2V7_9HYME|nr:hypothetical protein ALC62_14979 [Cyphomyrmex costatus]
MLGTSILLIIINMSSKFRRCIQCKMWKNWQLFDATDFQSLMYPCFTFCRILGIFPYRINASTFKITKQRYILTTVIICVFCIHELILLCKINITGTIVYNTIPMTLERNCFFILGGFIAVTTYIMNGPRMHLLQSIMEISLRLSPDSYRKLSRMIHAKDIFGFFFLIGRMIYFWSVTNFSNMDRIFTFYINLIVFQMDMLHMNCVCVLTACFKEINDNLTNLRKHVVNDELYNLRETYHEQRKPFLLMKLKALKKQHLMISDTVKMLNTIFSLQLLATIVMTFAELTFYIYFCILHWKSDMHSEHRYFYPILIIYLTYQCIKISLIGWACDTGKDEALQLFSLQVLYQENAFSAKGLIIDATLLVAIVSNITTYSLILIQFIITEQVCKKKITNNIT